tara:strand:+ start:557 stop:973 length:417 start_codon:yes stop_codon:yes gene_type:complete
MHKSLIANNQQQCGSAMLVVLFMTVLVAFFSAKLMALNVQSGQSNTYEIMSTQAYWAARSSLEREVYAYFPNQVSGTPPTPATCSNASDKPITIPQYVNCSIVVSCTPNGDAVLLESTAVCSENSYRVSRRLEVEIRP